VSVELVGIEEMIRAAVREELARQPDRSPWLNVEDAAEYLRTSKDAIRALVRRGDLPVHRTLNGRLLFRRDELDAYAKAGDR
jgi:excisionase family DNA binding protein